MKTFILNLGIGVLCLSGVCNKGNASLNQTSNNTLIQQSDTLILKKPEDTAKKFITITAVGDIMFGTNFPNDSKLPPNDGKDLLDPVKNYLNTADITFGNAEGVFLNSGGIPKGSGANIYCFRQPESYVNYFVDAGFDLLSIANNHVGDFGEIGRKSTIETLKKTSLHFAGFSEYPFTIFEKDGVKYGFCAFSPNKGCVDFLDIENAKKLVSDLKKECDIVIVSFHGGAEGNNATRVPKKTELFLGGNRGDVYKFSHSVIDAGADIVLGHGPHVPRAIELYNNKLIAYSLGNFCTYGMFNLKQNNGIAPILNVTMDRKGNFVKGNIVSIKQLGEGGPLIDEEHKAAILIKTLTENDFPDTNLSISVTGEIEITHQ